MAFFSGKLFLMFIKEVVKKAKGKKYVQHQLVESIRTPAGPRQKMVLNLGVISLDKDKWKILANLIESNLHNQQRFFTEDAEVEDLAKQYAEKIRENRLICEAENMHDVKGYEKDYEEVDINSINNSDSKSIGPEYVVLSQMRGYGLDKILKRLKFDDKEIAYAKMLITARLVHPASERETARWIKETSAISEFFKKEIKVYDNALHRTSLKLWEHHQEIEAKLAEAAREIFSLKETIILYDLTNTYFAGSKKNSKIAKHGGKSKEKRNDRPLVTLALTVDGEGFPKQSKIYEGNVSEPGTLGYILEKLRCREDFFADEKTIVIDAGIASEENIALIKKKKFKYVAVSRKRRYEETLWDKSQEQEINLGDGKNKLKIKLAVTEEEAFLHCHSEIKKEKEEAIINRRIQSFEAGLIDINGKLKKKGTQKKYEQIIERIGRLKERYQVGNFYDIKIEKKDRDAISVKFTKNAKCEKREESFGSYVLRTNRLDLSEEEISQIHRSLTRIEDCFKAMKSIGLRPNHHQEDKSTSAHIHVSVIGVHVLTGILKRLRIAGMHDKWESIKNILDTHRRGTTTMNTRDNKIIDVRNCTAPTEKQCQIYRALGIKQTPLKKVKIKAELKKNSNSIMDAGNLTTPELCSDENENSKMAIQ
ncbi:MAG: IS1634 family transposase [candidate division Zixibacteria bacterium]|nr:IS1634 family transposase [candidate division Zixibacteria bacterium]